MPGCDLISLKHSSCHFIGSGFDSKTLTPACIRATHVVAELDDVEKGVRKITRLPPVDGGCLIVCKAEKYGCRFAVHSERGTVYTVPDAICP